MNCFNVESKITHRCCNRRLAHANHTGSGLVVCSSQRPRLHNSRPARHLICHAADRPVQPLSSSEDAFVPGQEAQTRQQLFNNIAPIYDELNDKLSFGQHWVWKRMAVKWSGAKPGQTVLDVCCGSGDIAFLLAQAVGPTGQVLSVNVLWNEAPGGNNLALDAHVFGYLYKYSDIKSDICNLNALKSPCIVDPKAKCV